MKEAVPSLAMLFLLLILQVTFVIERTWSLNQSQGHGFDADVPRERVRKKIQTGDVDGAIRTVRQAAWFGRERHACRPRALQALIAESAPNKIVAETQAAIRKPTVSKALLLERNLIALSTIASIPTDGRSARTVVSMIRSFAALSHTGAVDATKLAVGISSAHQHGR